jgi:hypothetical protein
MPITVRRLIEKLQAIENQMLEVKVVCHDLKMVNIDRVRPTNMKFVVIETELNK